MLPDNGNLLVSSLGLINIVAIVWGASRVTSKLEALTKDFDSMKEDVKDFKEKQDRIARKVEIIWDGRNRGKNDADDNSNY